MSDWRYVICTGCRGEGCGHCRGSGKRKVLPPNWQAVPLSPEAALYQAIGTAPLEQQHQLTRVLHHIQSLPASHELRAATPETKRRVA